MCAQDLEIVEIQALRITFVVIRDRRAFYRLRCNLLLLLEFTFGPALRLLGLFFLARTFFLSFGKCSARVSPHQHSSRKIDEEG